MRGIRGISKELDGLLEPLSSKDLAHIVDLAFIVALDEYGDDPDIRGAIEAYRANPVAARALVDSLSKLSIKCDAEYLDAEDLGQDDKSAKGFRKMCALNGLTLLLSAPLLTPKVVDRFLYDLGYGSANTDLFAERMIEKLR